MYYKDERALSVNFQNHTVCLFLCIECNDPHFPLPTFCLCLAVALYSGLLKLFLRCETE
jgi:hypothetical protein